MPPWGGKAGGGAWRRAAARGAPGRPGGECVAAQAAAQVPRRPEGRQAAPQLQQARLGLEGGSEDVILSRCARSLAQ